MKFETYEEAREKEKELQAKVNELVDQMMQSSSKKERKEILKRFEALQNELGDIRVQYKRLTNGQVEINRKGTKMTLYQKKISNKE